MGIEEAQGIETKSINCRHLNGAGNLTAKFASVPWSGELLLASTGEKPSLRTRFKCFWDEESISFLIESEDTDIRATMKEPNSQVWLEEAVEVFIAPGSEAPKVYYEFQLSPANVSRQVKVTASSGKGCNFTFDASWRCEGIKTETYVHGYLNDPSRKSEGWEGIISLPLKSLSKDSSPVRAGDVWRVNIFRIERWPTEMFCAWSPTFHNPPMFHSPKHFGRLIFV